MTHVVFVAPYLAPATMRFVRALASRQDVRCSVVTQSPSEDLPPDLRERLEGHWRVHDALDPAQLVRAVEALWQRLGPPARLTGILEQLQVPLAEARAHLGIPGLPPAAARNFRDKARMKDVLRAAGLPCARHRLAADADSARAFARECGFPLVVKPPAGAGALSTFRVDDATALEQAMAMTAPSAEHPVLLEEFVVGREHSFDSVVVGGRPAWHSFSRYVPAPLEVLRHPWIQWCVILPREIDGPPWDSMRDLGFRAVLALGLVSGISHLEWFQREDGSFAISEVGARPPGAQFTSLLSWAHDTDLYAAWARLVVEEAFDPPPRTHAVGAAFLRGQGRGRVRAVHGLEAAQRELGPLVVEAQLPAEGQPHREGYEGDGHVILRHPDTAVVERGLARLLELVRVELA